MLVYIWLVLKLAKWWILVFQANTDSPAYILFEGEVSYTSNLEDMKIFIEETEVSQSPDFLQAFEAFFASFYVFNLSYPFKISKTLIFFQKFLCGLQDETNNHKQKAISNLISKLKVD